MSPAMTFIFLLVGIFGIYCEFVWPGRIFPAIFGVLSAGTGAVGFLRMRLDGLGVAMLTVAVGLLLLDAYWQFRFWAGAAGTLALTAGFAKLLGGRDRLSLALVLPACLVFGVSTLLLADVTKRARLAKWRDLA